mmetsp:Transcript_33688/g.40785  ORF Transcript_33688/g.40785 Transcript_33688/m.40785 type:complete len:171 (+) Transcript_33688:455-967(+)
MERTLLTVKVISIFDISIEWDIDTPAPRQPTKILNLFNANKVTKEDIKKHSDMIWSTAAHGGLTTPDYFRTFVTKHADTAELNTGRKNQKLKNMLAGNKIWNSFTDDFQLDLLNIANEFKHDDKFDRAQLWYETVTCVNPSTVIGASNLKEELKSKSMGDFGHNVPKYNI